MKRGFIFVGLTLLAAIAVCLEILIMPLEMAVYGVSSMNGWSVLQSVLHWGIVCIAWGISFAGIRQLAKKQGFDMLENKKKQGSAQCAVIILLIIAGIIYMCSTWDFQWKPLVEWSRMKDRFGTNGSWAFLFQYLYYLFESLLITTILSLGQTAGECFFIGKMARQIPWGGIFCFLTWGMLHGVSKDWNTALLCIVLSLIFGVIYLVSGKNFRYTYLGTALIFLL